MTTLPSGDLSAPVGLSGTLQLTTAPFPSGTITALVDLSAFLDYDRGLVAWDADQSQRFLVPVGLSATLQHFPAAVAPPLGQVNTWRQSVTYPNPVLDGVGRPVDWNPTSTVAGEFGRLQLIIDGQDVTFLRDISALVIDWSSAEPFGDSDCTLDFAQVTEYEVLGVGDRSAFRAGRHVDLLLVRPDDSRAVLWSGLFVTPRGNTEEAGGNLNLECQGALFQADWGLKPPGFSLEPRDIGLAIADTLNEYVSRDYGFCAPVVTGILTLSRGAWTPRLSGYVQDLLATATTPTGGQWTVAQEGRVPVVRLKDRTTVHATCIVGQPGVTTDLASDLLAGANVYYGEGIDPDGCHWRNTKYPNLRTDDAPVYPHPAGQTFVAGNGRTGFQPFVDEMRAGGYVMASGNTYVAADVDEVRDAQARAGINVDGIVGPQTWAAIFQTGSNGGDLSGAYFAPLVSEPAVEPRLFNAKGVDIGANAAFDPDVPRVERYINYGEGVTKQEATVSARAELERDRDPGWAGSITFTADPQERSRFELRAGMNVLLRQHRGVDRLMHVAQTQVDWRSGSVSCDVDEKARDLVSLAAIKTRNRDARSDPGRRGSTQRRSSRQVDDAVSVFDCESGAGVVPRHALFKGLWTVLRIPAGQVGSIARTEFSTDSAVTPFALGVFSGPVTANHLKALVGNPLAADRPWNTSADALLDLGILEAWGSQAEPCGYYPGALSEGDGLTGRFFDGAAWTYESQHPPYLWVAEYAPVSCFIQGRLYAAVT